MAKKKELTYKKLPNSPGEKVARWNYCQVIGKMIYISSLSTDHIGGLVKKIEQGAKEILVKVK